MEKNKIYKASAAFLVALCLLGITAAAYFYNNKVTIVADGSGKAMSGKPLAAFDDIYPIVVDGSGQLHLDKNRFVKAVAYLKKNPSEQAIADLVYLGQQNNITIELTPEEKNDYQALASELSSDDLNRIVNRRDALFQTYKDVVNSIGRTFAGTGIEIVLHDTRNPIRSIVAIQNPISGRQLGGPNTNFGVQLIKDYSVVNMRGASYESYPLTLKDGRAVKSTTVPIFDERYGLIGFICLNIDISKLQAFDQQAVKSFIQAVVKTNEQDKINELVDNSKREIKAQQESKD